MPLKPLSHFMDSPIIAKSHLAPRFRVKSQRAPRFRVKAYDALAFMMKGQTVEEFRSRILSSSWADHVAHMQRLTEQLVRENQAVLRWLAHTKELEASLAWHRRELYLMSIQPGGEGGMGRGKGKGKKAGKGKGL